MTHDPDKSEERDSWDRRSPDRHVESNRKESQSGDWRSQGGQTGEGQGWISRGYLPHYDGRAVIQHVTVHLADSLPKSAIERIECSLEGLPDDRRTIERRERLHELVDAGQGSCVLRHRTLADIAQSTFLHFDGVRYHLHAWVVMPNHFHVLFEPVGDWALPKIVGSWKKFTARKIKDYLKEANQEIGDPRNNANHEMSGPGIADLPIGINEPVWSREYWDRFIRNERHYHRIVAYIHSNPVASGLVEHSESWPWSSANKTSGEK